MMPVFRAQPAGNLIKTTGRLPVRRLVKIQTSRWWTAVKPWQPLDPVEWSYWIFPFHYSSLLCYFPFPDVGNNVLNILEMIKLSDVPVTKQAHQQKMARPTEEPQSNTQKSESLKVHLHHSRHPKWLSAGVSAASTSWTQSERKTDDRGDYITVQRATLFCHQKKGGSATTPPV